MKAVRSIAPTLLLQFCGNNNNYFSFPFLLPHTHPPPLSFSNALDFGLQNFISI